MVQRQLSRVYHICQSVSFVAGPRRAQQHRQQVQLSCVPALATSDFTSTPLADHPGQKVYSTSQTRIQNLKSYKDTSVHRCDYTPYCSLSRSGIHQGAASASALAPCHSSMHPVAFARRPPRHRRLAASAASAAFASPFPIVLLSSFTPLVLHTARLVIHSSSPGK